MSTENDAPTPRPNPADAIQARPGSPGPSRKAGTSPLEPSTPTAIVANIDAAIDANDPPFEESPLLGRDIRERPRFPFWSVVYLLLGAAAFGFLGSREWPATVILGPIGFSLAIVFAYDWLRPRRFRLSSGGLTCSRPRLFVPFGEIRDVVSASAKKGGGAFPVHVISRNRSIAIPERLSCDSSDFVRLLRSQVRVSSSLPLAPALFDGFLKQQTMLYPSGSIHVFRGSSRTGRSTSTRTLVKITIALLLPLPVWIAFAIAYPRREEFFGWALAFGIFALLFGIFAFASLFARRTRVKNADDAVLIVTPGGLALCQAELRGELRWTEVQKVRRSGGGSFQWTAQIPGLALRVQGADVVIADIYDWPIDAIQALIQRYSGRR